MRKLSRTKRTFSFLTALLLVFVLQSTVQAATNANENSAVVDTDTVAEFFLKVVGEEALSRSYVDVQTTKIRSALSVVFARPLSKIPQPLPLSISPRNSLSESAISFDLPPTESYSGPLRVLVIHSNDYNAYATKADFRFGQPAEIVLTTGLVGSVEEPAELSFAIAHEFAHIIYDHFAPSLPEGLLLSGAQRARIEQVHRGWELAADAWAGTLLIARGYSVLPAVSKVLSHAATTESLVSLQFRHPAPSERLKQLARMARLEGSIPSIQLN